MRDRQAGITLIEMMIAMLMMVLIGVGLWTLLRSTYDSQYTLLNQNNAIADARVAVDTLADQLRGAKTITAATVSDITFTNNSGNVIRYWLSGTTLRKTVGGSPYGGAIVVSDVYSLTFTYWLWNGTAWSTSTAPSDVSQIRAAVITVEARVNGYQRRLSSFVKCRNL